MNTIVLTLKYTLKMMLWSFALFGIISFYIFSAFDKWFVLYFISCFVVSYVIADRKKSNQNAADKAVKTFIENCKSAEPIE